MFTSCSKNEKNEPAGGTTGITIDPGVVINGTCWATRNVNRPGYFTAKPEDSGIFYQWNSKTGWSATGPLASSNGTDIWNYGWGGDATI